MRRIMVLNSKGGCGKSTIATNLASYYADQGYSVCLADFDPQGSSMDWAARRSAKRAPITAIEASKDGMRGVPRKCDFLILDAPAACENKELKKMVRRAETIIVPVLPSVTDMNAANRFLRELFKIGKVKRREIKVAVVANRVREHTRIFEELDAYLVKKRIPYVGTLRDTQNYIRAYERGIGVYEMPEHKAGHDQEEWNVMLNWLASRRSQPAPKE